MGLTSFPGGVRAAPLIGGGQTRFNGWWTGKSWFVDRDHGPNGNGDSPDSAFVYLDDALTAAGAGDAIYIRPRDADATNAPTDPQSITPKATTANWNIPRAKWGLFLIGAGPCLGAQGEIRGITLQGASGVTTATLGSSVLTVRAPYTTIENLAFKRGGTTRALLELYGDGTGVANAYGSSVQNCLFRLHNQNAYGALHIQDAWECGVYGCTFDRNKMALQAVGSASTLERLEIIGCTFRGDGTAQDGNIYIAGSAPDFILVAHNKFMAAVPSVAGAVSAYYIKIPTSTTMSSVFGNHFAIASASYAASVSYGTRVLASGNYAQASLVA